MRTLRLAAPVLLVALAGCAGKYPVRGTVTYDDGTPVTKGLVVFERTAGGPPVTARGQIQPDGHYELSTDKPGDRVLLNPLDLSDVPDEQKVLPFDLKFLKFETSGLEYEVKSGPNEYPITVTRQQKKK